MSMIVMFYVQIINRLNRLLVMLLLCALSIAVNEEKRHSTRTEANPAVIAIRYSLQRIGAMSQ